MAKPTPLAASGAFENPQALAPLTLSWRSLLGWVIVATMLVPPGVYRIPMPGLPADMEVYRLLVFLFILLWGVSLLTDESTRLRPTGIDGYLAFLFVAVCLSDVINLLDTRVFSDSAGMVKALLYLSGPLLLVYAVNSVIRSREDVEGSLKLIVWLGVVIAFFGMVERATQVNVFLHYAEAMPLLALKNAPVGDAWADVRRIAGPAIHSIAFAVVLGMILPLAIHYARVAHTWLVRISYSIAATMVGVTMLLTGSRTSFIAFLLILGVLWLGSPQVRKWTIPGVIAIAVVMHVAFPGAIGMLMERLSPSYQVRTEVGNQYGRLTDYPRIAAYVRLRPLLGMGYGMWNPKVLFFIDNQYLIMLLEVGLLGMAAFISVFVAAFLRLYNAGRSIRGELGDLATALATSIAVFAVTSITYDSFGFPQPFYLFSILLGLGVSFVLGLKGPYAWNGGRLEAPATSTAADARREDPPHESGNVCAG